MNVQKYEIYLECLPREILKNSQNSVCKLNSQKNNGHISPTVYRIELSWTKERVTLIFA